MPEMKQLITMSINMYLEFTEEENCFESDTIFLTNQINRDNYLKMISVGKKVYFSMYGSDGIYMYIYILIKILFNLFSPEITYFIGLANLTQMNSESLFDSYIKYHRISHKKNIE